MCNVANHSRSYLKQGPSAAEVKGVELIQEKKDISEDEAHHAVGGTSDYEVRR